MTNSDEIKGRSSFQKIETRYTMHIYNVNEQPASAERYTTPMMTIRCSWWLLNFRFCYKIWKKDMKRYGKLMKNTCNISHCGVKILFSRMYWLFLDVCPSTYSKYYFHRQLNTSRKSLIITFLINLKTSIICSVKNNSNTSSNSFGIKNLYSFGVNYAKLEKRQSLSQDALIK